ncbi:hypothetical protein ASPBRDRAFT_39920 [Aspergillus brasiliensis CBS 101740]|uniref:Uncharacterized protein n=1 Tax=Aspergillus brasiliensis (strain CBS 101740 / IMI 381727 / IBT 21946) TaxID=767769 RepID=A0A1L9USZ0_ASPBC|nr:hypothetical protein ASPBRDRAFT_39920 [Aspergillus brasiliensis CBS 101740]
MTLRDLKNLSEASKSISEKTLPYLYGNLIIQAKYPSAPKLDSAIAKINHSRLVHTKHIRLWGTYHQIQEKQTCSIHDFLEDDVTGPISRLWLLC